jgi:nicotinamidase-related amidase
MRPTQRLTARHGALLVVDLQDKLLALIPDRGAVVAKTVALIRGARALGLPVWATEQYPSGLGPSAAEIVELIPQREPKTTFHCCGVPQLLEQLYGRNIRHVTLAGIEAHVCVAQTALELLDLGFRVQVPADAVASRHDVDREFALRRLENAGAIISTTESVLFEWTERSDRPEFKAISELIKSLSAGRRPEKVVGQAFEPDTAGR